MSRLRGLVLVAAIAVGCRPGPSTVAHVDLPPSASSRAPAAIDPCPGVEAHIVALLRAELAKTNGGATRWGKDWTDARLVAAIPRSGLGCVAFPGGAWAIEPIEGSIDLENSDDVSAHVTIGAYVDGKKLASWGDVYVGYGGAPKTMSHRLVTDYDGDGVPELYVRTDEDGVEGGHFSETWVLTVRDRARMPVVAPVEALAKLGEIGEPVDVDGDGRLDFPVSLGQWLVSSGDCYGKDDDDAADFLAHSRVDGTFSIDDEVALAHARAWCPVKPPTIAKPVDALCAALRAKTTSELASERARVTASCVPWDCEREERGAPQAKGADRACRGVRESFPDSPPVRL